MGWKRRGGGAELMDEKSKCEYMAVYPFVRCKL